MGLYDFNGGTIKPMSGEANCAALTQVLLLFVQVLRYLSLRHSACTASTVEVNGISTDLIFFLIFPLKL